MPKRKRDGGGDVEEKFSRHRLELFRALKAAKGFERQRLAKRIRDEKSTPKKVQRLEREVVVLKSLDLQQAAHAHLCSSLLKLRVVADSPNLPEQIRAGVPKPEISEEERAALHNVTSALYNRSQVRSVVDRAISGVCEALGVSVPKKKGSGGRGDRGYRRDEEEQPADRSYAEPEPPSARRNLTRDRELGGRAAEGGEAPDDSPSESADGDITGLFRDEEEEEGAISRLEEMLGVSSDDEDGDPTEDTGAGKDPLGISSDDGDDETEEGTDEELEESSSDEVGNASSDLELPVAKKAVPKPGKQARATNSTFLPTLMGGYISGSESASDIDVAPATRKNRRGQKARQAIWEKKYGGKAKHLGKDKKGSRDSGWDLKRGAVDSESKPWKRGIRNPLDHAGKSRNGGPYETGPAETKGGGEKRKARDDEGPLHPSWEARKKAKEMQRNATFQGKKITF